MYCICEQMDRQARRLVTSEMNSSLKDDVSFLPKMTGSQGKTQQLGYLTKRVTETHVLYSLK